MTAPLTLTLLDGSTALRVEGITSLVASDASGQFGVEPGHVPLLTVLEPGLLRYRIGGRDWTWAACAGGMLRCVREDGASQVTIVSRRFLRGTQPEELQARLDALLAAEGALRVSTRESRERMEQALHRRLQELAGQGP